MRYRQEQPFIGTAYEGAGHIESIGGPMSGPQSFDNISSKFVVEEALGSVAVALANVSSCHSQATRATSTAS